MVSSSNAPDTIIIGGGHNGLVAATYLARAGCRVLLLERRNHLGGGAITEELWPGYHFSTCAHLLHRMPPRIFEDFHLENHGIEVVEREHPVFLRNDGTYSTAGTHESPKNWEFPGNLSREQRRQRAEYNGFKDGLSELFLPYRLAPMPSRAAFLKTLDASSRRLVEKAERTSTLQLQDEYLTDPGARAPYELDIMSYSSNPGSLCLALAGLSKDYPGEGEPRKGFVRGGMGKITEALEKEARAAGVEIQTGVECRQIAIEHGRATGVLLADGSFLPARRVVSNLDPKRTFLQLVDPQWIDSELHNQLKNLGSNESCMKFFAVISELPEWKDWDGDPAYPASGAMFPHSTREEVQSAYRDVAAGRPPRTPVMSFNLPSFRDRSLAAGDNQSASVWIYPAPYELQGTTWDECREEVMDDIINQVQEKAPNFRDSIREAKLRTPIDLVRENAMTDGNIWHVPHTQEHIFWNRPLPALRNYQCPIQNLYLCGSGQHPGGEVTGMPGHNAAHLILETL